MPVPMERDVAETEQRLGGWLARRIPGATDVEVFGLSVPEGTGYSNETLMFDASWREGGEPVRRSLVARLEPTRYQVLPEPGIRREYDVITRLAACSDVPLPPTLWMEGDEDVLGAPLPRHGEGRRLGPGRRASLQRRGVPGRHVP